jgi:two-component system, OmpR family, sensor kinase
MTWPRTLPAKARLTLGFAVAMITVLLAAGAGLYAYVGAVLLDELDTGLRARAAIIEADLNMSGFRLAAPSPTLLEPTEEFAQILRHDGSMIDTSPGVTVDTLPPRLAATITTARFLQRHVTGVAGTARILALPAHLASTPVVLVVGASMSDRSDALHLITLFLLAGGPAAVLFASAVGWALAGAALRPVERMRRQAAAITASGLDHRLSVPEARDEFRRLAATLNDMLSRLDASMATERRFLDNASHELRTPLTTLKAEIDLALARPRPAHDLLLALHSAAEEVDRLVRMAEDLLVLARAQGRLALLRSPVSLAHLLTGSTRHFHTRAEAAQVVIAVEAPDITVNLDASRVRQAVDNLLDNAIRYAPAGSTVNVTADICDHVVRIRVDDRGPGIPRAYHHQVFDPYVRLPDARQNRQPRPGSGLGLAIVAAVASAHDGTATIEPTTSKGTRIELRLPDKPFPRAVADCPPDTILRQATSDDSEETPAGPVP